MDTPPLNPSQRELDRLSAEWFDEPSQDAEKRLSELLRESPELRDRFARTCGLELLIRAELSCSLPDFAAIGVSPSALLPSASGSTALESCERMVERLEADTGAQQTQPTTTARLWAGGLRWVPLGVGIAVSLLLMISPLGVGRVEVLSDWISLSAGAPSDQDLRYPSLASDPGPASPRETAGSARAASSSETANPVGRANGGVAGPQVPIVVRDYESLRLVSRLTRTALLTSMAMPATFMIEAPATRSIGRGAVLLDNVVGQRERGYLLSLPPGRSLEILVDANSWDENSLAIVEIGAGGPATGDAVSFTNTDSSATKQSRKVGVVGTWSVKNSTTRPRHFLFTGSHKLVYGADDGSWHLSDYRVGLETPSLLCIGWDDSGYQSANESHRTRLKRDYDDISVTIRINGATPDFSFAADNQQLLVNEPQIDQGLLASEGAACPLVVPPRSVAVVRVTADCSLPNAAAIVNAKTGRLVWRDAAWGSDQDPKDYQDLILADRGVCLLDNPTDEQVEYLLVAKNSMTPIGDSLKWTPSKAKVLLDSGELLVVGFDDSWDQEDWDDIHFYVRFFQQP